MKQKWKLFPLDWLSLFLISFGAICCLKTAYGFEAETPLWFWCFLLTGAFCALFRLEKGWIAVLLSGLLWVLCCLYFHNKMLEELRYFGRLILDRVGNAYPWLGSRLTVAEPGDPIDLSGLFVAMAALLSLLLCALTVRSHALVATLLVGFLTLAPCYFITNTPPRAIYLLLALFGMLTLAFSHGTRKYLPDEAPRAALYALIPALLALGLALYFFPEQGYEPPVDPNRLTEKLSSLGENLTERLPSGDGEVMEQEHVALRNLGPKQQRKYTALTVTAMGELDGYLYLRGMAYEGFDGFTWTLGPNTESDGSLYRSPYPSLETCEVRIHTPIRPKTLYTPNYLNGTDLETVFDYYIPNTEQTRDYSFQTALPDTDSYILFGFQPGPAMDKLQQDAYANCLYLPADTRESLNRIARENGIATAGSIQDLAETIISFVRNSAVYDLSPDYPPEDRDFCTWFLTEADRGYCVHFATAATAMLRAVGIPARYVEGYITATLPNVEVEVQARQAHAWVEVFFDGTGWVRYDPTPSDGVHTTAEPYSEIEEPTEASTEAPTEAPTEVSEKATEPSSASTESDTEASTEPEAPQKTPGKPLILKYWKQPAVALLIACVFLLRVLRQRRRKRQYVRADINRKALLDWKYYLQLCKATKTAPDSKLEDLAKKAHFSQHQLTHQERERMRSAVQTEIVRLRNLPLPQRLWYSYWLL